MIDYYKKYKLAQRTKINALARETETGSTSSNSSLLIQDKLYNEFKIYSNAASILECNSSQTSKYNKLILYPIQAQMLFAYALELGFKFLAVASNANTLPKKTHTLSKILDLWRVEVQTSFLKHVKLNMLEQLTCYVKNKNYPAEEEDKQIRIINDELDRISTINELKNYLEGTATNDMFYQIRYLCDESYNVLFNFNHLEDEISYTKHRYLAFIKLNDSGSKFFDTEIVEIMIKAIISVNSEMRLTTEI